MRLADDVVHLGTDALQLFAQVAAGPVRAKQQIDQSPKDREQQDGDEPRDLVGGVALAVDDA